MAALERTREGSKSRRAAGTTAASSKTADEQLDEMIAVEQARALTPALKRTATPKKKPEASGARARDWTSGVIVSSSAANARKLWVTTSTSSWPTSRSYRFSGMLQQARVQVANTLGAFAGPYPGMAMGNSIHAQLPALPERPEEHGGLHPGQSHRPGSVPGQGSRTPSAVLASGCKP